MLDAAGYPRRNGTRFPLNLRVVSSQSQFVATAQIVKENLARRSGELERAESIVEEEVHKFMAWIQSREIIPTVVALRERFETIRQAELARLDAKLSNLPPEARDRVDEITQLIVQKLLLTPTEQLKSLRDESTVATYSDALNRLFGLGSDDAEQAPRPKARVSPMRRD